jgi:peptidoglycan hydrolase CwlO-like protein
VGVYDQVKSAFQDIIAPEIQALRSDIQRLDQKIDGVDARLSTKLDGLKSEILPEIRRLDEKIDALEAKIRP